ncbi:hypothetical protein BS78_04G026300 [Paspalum vaginatum]|uniref:Uncharacterized protein n=1 Tax=Paspalum vaginatum TaxID=158149 RepID=A0A9W7X7H5_9POAL|nr:hypothetical protein BS78_K251600 [Paspalum vaginatum]KAJ1277730.1 hypothetical protein BS78_04G026300 [Paspalum vaginatum]
MRHQLQSPSLPADRRKDIWRETRGRQLLLSACSHSCCQGGFSSESLCGCYMNFIPPYKKHSSLNCNTICVTFGVAAFGGNCQEICPAVSHCSTAAAGDIDAVAAESEYECLMVLVIHPAFGRLFSADCGCCCLFPPLGATVPAGNPVAAAAAAAEQQNLAQPNVLTACTSGGN